MELREKGRGRGDREGEWDCPRWDRHLSGSKDNENRRRIRSRSKKSEKLAASPSPRNKRVTAAAAAAEPKPIGDGIGGTRKPPRLRQASHACGWAPELHPKVCPWYGVLDGQMDYAYILSNFTLAVPRIRQYGVQ